MVTTDEFLRGYGVDIGTDWLVEIVHALAGC